MTVYFHFRREAGNGRQLFESAYIPEMNRSFLFSLTYRVVKTMKVKA
jgi:hypothetical protein